MRCPSFPGSRAVVLAAAPPGARWSPSRHRFFPLAFKQAARQLLLANNRLLGSAPAFKAAAGAAGPADVVQVATTGGAVGPCKRGLLTEALPACQSRGAAAGCASDAASPAGKDSSTSSASATNGAAPPRGLPLDAVHEVLRQLASFPLSFWMRQPAAAPFPPAAPPRTPPATAVPPPGPFGPVLPPPDAPHAAAGALPPLPFLHPINPQPVVPAGSIPAPEGPQGAA